VCSSVDASVTATYRKVVQTLKTLGVPMGDRPTKSSVCDNFFGSLLRVEAYPPDDKVLDVEKAFEALAAPLRT